METMETHVDQVANATVENSTFGVPISLISIVMYLLIFATIAGNLFVIAAVLSERNLQSDANYLILSLAVADLMVACLVMPFGAAYKINSTWSFGPVLCDIWTTCDVLCCTASILHLMVIAIDRYRTFTNISYAQAKNSRKIDIMIIAVWVVSLGIALAPQFGWKDPNYSIRIAQGTCLVSQDPAYQIFATCATFYIPLLVTLFLYWKIYQVVQKKKKKKPGIILQPLRERRDNLNLVTSSTQPYEESTFTTRTLPEKSSSFNVANATPSTSVMPKAVSMTAITITTKLMNPTSTSQQQLAIECTREATKEKHKHKPTKTLAIITGAFVVCWLPFFLATLLQVICPTCQPPEFVSNVFLWLGYFNSTLNPIIYTVFSPNFRQAFKKILCRKRRQ